MSSWPPLPNLYLRNRNHVPYFYRVIETWVKVKEASGECFHSVFEFSQAFTSVFSLSYFLIQNQNKLKTGNNEKSSRLAHFICCLVLYKNVNLWVGEWKSAMVDATKTSASPISHMTYTQAPAVCEKNIFHLFHFPLPYLPCF